MRESMRVGVTVLLLGLMAAASHAWPYYVSNVDGEDNEQCSEKYPCTTLQRAVDLSSAGDVIIVAGGGAPYEPVVVDHRISYVFVRIGYGQEERRERGRGYRGQGAKEG